jgi:hypothetical protein
MSHDSRNWYEAVKSRPNKETCDIKLGLGSSWWTDSGRSFRRKFLEAGGASI